jgi:hypothetical protein
LKTWLTESDAKRQKLSVPNKTVKNPVMKHQKVALSALAAAAVFAVGQAQAQTKLVAWWDFEKVESDGVSVKSVIGGYAGQITQLRHEHGARPATATLPVVPDRARCPHHFGGLFQSVTLGFTPLF